VHTRIQFCIRYDLRAVRWTREHGGRSEVPQALGRFKVFWGRPLLPDAPGKLYGFRQVPSGFRVHERLRNRFAFLACSPSSQLRGTPIALRGWQRGRIYVWSMKEALVMRRTLICSVTLLALVGYASLSHAQVSVNIGINLPAPPELAPVPSTSVMYAPGVGANYFFYGGEYYVFVNGGWFVSRGYTGPWALIAPEFVPRPILAVPVQYYQVPPSAWRGWRREAAPHWEPQWGQRWEERRPAERVQHREEPRGPRREDRREERHEDRR